MVQLYFLRHGVAFDPDEWTGDSDGLRPLTEAGMAAMQREAETLRSLDIRLDKLIASPLVRAVQTAQIVAQALHLDVEQNDLLRPGFDLKALDVLLNRYGSAGRIMVVGHESDFSQTIGQLIGGGSVVMKKGGLARVDLTNRNSLRGELVWLLTPALLKV
jgi:phosphohistidine phosphatase